MAKHPVKERFSFFNCASLTDVKRQTLLLYSLAKTKKGATLCIAGSGPEEKRLIALAEDLGLADRVFFAGLVEDPSDLYFSSRCFILTSKSEGNPITINEAMSAGLPVIAPRVGGIPDLVEPGMNGFLFDRDATPETVAGIMDMVMGLSDEELDVIKRNNQKKIAQWYMPNISADYARLFREKVVL